MIDKEKRNKRIIKVFVITISIIVIIGILNIIRLGYNETSKQKNYNVNVELISVATLNDDDIFYTKLKGEYKDFKLLFVSLDIKNNVSTNYDNLSYKLITSNNNIYNCASSYITNDEEFLENYYKINNKIFDDETEDLLGNKSKRVIMGFMVPENEITNDTVFTLQVSSFNLNEEDVEKVKFNSNDITKSYAMKELYKEEEVEKAEQTISLAYLSSINDWMGWMVKLEQTYNYQYDDLFNVAFITIKTFADSADYNYGWNGRKIETNGYKLDFDKAKKFYPEIADKIENVKNAIDGVKKLYKDYDKTINSLDKKELQKVDSGIISFNDIKQYFGLTYYY